MVTIKNMTMPTRCKDCDAFVRYSRYAGDPGDEFCGLTKQDVDPETLGEDCPLIVITVCEDCINFLNNHLCLHWSKHGTIETKSDDFCSYGEK